MSNNDVSKGNTFTLQEDGQPKGSIKHASLKRRSLRASKSAANSTLPSVSWIRVLRVNSFCWFIIFMLGVVGALVQGIVFPTFAYFFGQVLRVFTLPFNQVLGAIHMWAGMFLVLGFISGVATFAKVRNLLMGYTVLNSGEFYEGSSFAVITAN